MALFQSVVSKAPRYKLFFGKALLKRLQKLTIITKRLSLTIKKMIIISENGNYNDYNKQRWQFLIASFVNSETND